MKKADFILIISIVLAMVFAYYTVLTNQEPINVNEDVYVEIRVDGELIDRVLLNDDTNYDKVIDDGTHYNEIIIDSNGAYMKEANCPDQVCVKTGVINANTLTRNIVCAPNSIVISIVGSNSKVDG